MKNKILYYDNDKLNWNEIISEYRKTLPEGEKVQIVCRPMKARKQDSNDVK